MNLRMMQANFFVIGAGLAGSEASLVLANAGAKVLIHEQKPKFFSGAHKLNTAAELVCSNSFKSTELTSAHGLLKKELELLDSPLMTCAYQSRVPGGKALSIDREKFSLKVHKELNSHPNIKFVEEQVSELSESIPTLIATGPLTSENLSKEISKKCLQEEEELYFYDSTSPTVQLDSLDMNHFFWANRNQDGDDYLNLPLNKEEYTEFRNDLLSAEKVEAHLPEEKLKFFEGCLPVEVLAERGEKTLAYSCMRPIGLVDPRDEGKRYYAIIQFRREKAAGELLNMVGFQTRMKWPEQERVFRKLPGMKNAVFARLGAMHRNTFINSPKHLSHSLNLKKVPHIFMAGQITGSEGYSEAVATGHYAALQMLGLPSLPENTALRSLVRYLIDSDPKHFQPMNFNFGLLPPLVGFNAKMRSKGQSPKHYKNGLRSTRAIDDLKAWVNSHWNNSQRTFSRNNHLKNNLVLTPTELDQLTSDVS